MKVLGRYFALSFAAIAALFALGTETANGAVFDVDRTDDNASATACTAAPNDCSLRGAILVANGNGEADTINLQPTTYTLGPAASTCEDAAADGDLDITDELVIAGNGATIDGADVDRVFDILTNNGNFSVSLSDLTIQNGTAQIQLNTCAAGGDGGGIRIAAGMTVNLSNVVVTSNVADGGGGIANNGILSIQDSTISENNAADSGGGIYNQDSGTQVILRSTISGNTAVDLGGGIYDNHDPSGVTETTRIVESTISGNTADDGGGLYADANIAESVLNLINTTVSGNTALNEGGGVYVCYGTVNLRNVTVTANTSTDGGGVALPSCGESVMNLRNTIIAGNTDLTDAVTPDCFREDPSDLFTEDFNLIGDETGCNGLFTGGGDQFGSGLSPLDPGLGPLADNGGPTQTHALASTSPAVDNANPAGCFSNDGALLSTDQRGSPRPLDGGVAGPAPAVCDIGAFELGGCGDGFQDPSEACDDGNTVTGDGCSSTCQLEGCGDGVVIAPETCDDGNTADGDGCSANCQNEVPTPSPTATPVALLSTQGGCLGSLSGATTSSSPLGFALVLAVTVFLGSVRRYKAR